jgi:oligopeptide transport system substrate-binding protein
MKRYLFGFILICFFVLGIIKIVLQPPLISADINNKPSIFRMALTSEPPTLDWNMATDNVSFTVITNLMEGLTEYDQNLKPRSSISKHWDISPNGKIYTFYLREDVHWSDGKAVTAYDFEYSWKRLLNPLTAAEYAYFLYDVVNAYEYNTGQINDPSLVGVRALNSTVLQVHLNKPIVYFPSITTFMVTFPIRQDIVERYGDKWTEPENIVTNGPFRLIEWRHEYKLRLKTNQKYYGRQPSLDEIRFFIVNVPTTALSLYETGDLELVNLPPEAIKSYASSAEYVRQPLLRGYYYGFNTEKTPFNITRIRRAFSMAIDREEIPRILQGGQIATSSWIPPGMFGYDPSIGFEFNPIKARKLLAEAGYPGGKGLPGIIATYNTNPVHTLIAENLQAQWKRNLGITVDLDNQEWKVYLKRLKTDTPALFRLGWGADYPDPDNFMVLFTSDSGNNNTHWGNSYYDDLIAKAAVERDPLQRQKLYGQAQQILVEEDAVIMPLFIAAQNILVKPYVTGIQFNAMELLYLKNIQLTH